MAKSSKKQAILIALTLVLGLGLFGCGRVQLTENNNANKNINANINILADWQTCKDEILGLQFKYPVNWGKCKIKKMSEKNIDKFAEYSVMTDYKPYNVDLTIQLRKMDQKKIEEYKNKTFGAFNVSKIGNNDYFNFACGGALFCGGVFFENNNGFEIYFGVDSNQPVPENLVGIWEPDHNIKKENLRNILETFTKI